MSIGRSHPCTFLEKAVEKDPETAKNLMTFIEAEEKKLKGQN